MQNSYLGQSSTNKFLGRKHLGQSCIQMDLSKLEVSSSIFAEKSVAGLHVRAAPTDGFMLAERRNCNFISDRQVIKARTRLELMIEAELKLSYEKILVLFLVLSYLF
ncbi:hypothetical protein QL285_049998 [Trifolium repens]|nr:hypothetical protein QL285_049998 [Trifolium repens]